MTGSPISPNSCTFRTPFERMSNFQGFDWLRWHEGKPMNHQARAVSCFHVFFNFMTGKHSLKSIMPEPTLSGLLRALKPPLRGPTPDPHGEPVNTWMTLAPSSDDRP